MLLDLNQMLVDDELEELDELDEPESSDDCVCPIPGPPLKLGFTSIEVAVSLLPEPELELLPVRMMTVLPVLISLTLAAAPSFVTVVSDVIVKVWV